MLGTIYFLLCFNVTSDRWNLPLYIEINHRAWIIAKTNTYLHDASRHERFVSIVLRITTARGWWRSDLHYFKKIIGSNSAWEFDSKQMIRINESKRNCYQNRDKGDVSVVMSTDYYVQMCMNELDKGEFYEIIGDVNPTMDPVTTFVSVYKSMLTPNDGLVKHSMLYKSFCSTIISCSDFYVKQIKGPGYESSSQLTVGFFTDSFMTLVKQFDITNWSLSISAFCPGTKNNTCCS